MHFRCAAERGRMAGVKICNAAATGLRVFRAGDFARGDRRSVARARNGTWCDAAGSARRCNKLPPRRIVAWLVPLAFGACLHLSVHLAAGTPEVLVTILLSVVLGVVSRGPTCLAS